METATLILSIAAIAVSVFAIVISWILYNKSDVLNKEMRDFVVEIKTITGKMYTDFFGLHKQSYEKLLLQGIGEPKGLADDKIVTDIIENVSNKVEEKFLIEIERIKTGENVRDDEVNRLKADLENIIKKIPEQVDESKKTKMNLIKSEIIKVVRDNKGITPSRLINYGSLDAKYITDYIMQSLIELIREGYIISKNGAGQTIGFDEPMLITNKKS